MAWKSLPKLSSEDGCSELMVSTWFYMCSDENFIKSSWCSSLNSINSSYFFSKLWYDGEILAWNFLRLITLFWMCSVYNMFDFSVRSSTIGCRLSSCILNFYQLFLVTSLVRWLVNQSYFCVACRAIFISTVEVLLILV